MQVLDQNQVVSENFKVWDKVYTDGPRLRYPDLMYIHFLMKYVPLEKTKTALILGPGDGTEAFPLARLGIKTTGVDLCEKAAERLNKFAQEDGFANLITASQGDQRDLSRFPANSFDLVVSWSVISYLTKEDGQKAINEINRVLKPGGSFIGLLESTEHTGYTQDGAIKVSDKDTTFQFPVNTKQSRAGLVMTFYDANESKTSLKSFKQLAMSHRVMSLPPDLESKVGQWMFHCTK